MKIKLESYMYVLLRGAFAIVLFTHGLPKVLETAHGSMADPMAGTINLIQNVIGLPFAPQLALMVTALETIGALMLLVGFCTRTIAFLFALEMLAICYALGPTWAWFDRGIEFPFLMGFLAIYMASRDDSNFSIGRLISSRLTTLRLGNKRSN